MKVDELIERFRLEPIDQEGGWFKRVYTGELSSEGRASTTSIYALFTREQFSALHRLDAVEQFFFLDGDAFEVFRIESDGSARHEILQRKTPHLVFEPGCWFGGKPIAGGVWGWTLMSCVVTPGFQWEGFEIGEREALLKMYPNYDDWIRDLTR